MMYCQHYTVLMIASNIKIIIISESTPVCCTSIPSITACMINSAGNLASTGYFQKKHHIIIDTKGSLLLVRVAKQDDLTERMYTNKIKTLNKQCLLNDTAYS